MICILLAALTYLAVAILVTVALRALKSPFGSDLNEAFGLGWPVTILCLGWLALMSIHRWASGLIAKGFGL